MKIFTKLFTLILLTCILVKWTVAQSTCNATIPEFTTRPIITVETGSTLTFPTLTTVSNLPDLEYAIQLVGVPATDSLGDQIISFVTNNTINIDDFGLTSGNQFRVTPVSYDLVQVQSLINSLFNNSFFGAPCCTIAGLALPDVCPNLQMAGISQGEDLRNLNDIGKLFAVFFGEPDITFSVAGFAAQVDELNTSASALPGVCGGSQLPVCYAIPPLEEGSQIYEAITNFPIELTKFEAYAEQKYNRLKWTTATEENNAYFSIQRSANGQYFTEIGRISGSGTTTDDVNYEFTDAKPLSQLNYYRLQQVDFDGKSSFSDIVSVKRKDAEIFDIISAGPNPNNGEMEVTILNEQSGSVDYIITNINGKVLTQNTFTTTEGLNTFKVDIRNFPTSVYFISVKKDELNAHLKFLKK